MLNDLSSYVDKMVEKYQLPALSIAVWHGNNFSTAAAGFLNCAAEEKATPDSVFQIGSITKIFTTCLVMQLVDEGKVVLDMPVKSYLPDFKVADARASDIITLRQLLNHTNGIDGDYFPDDEAQQGNLIARYVDSCSMLPLVHPVGEMFCYSNAAFVVAGRLVEVIRGVSWQQAIKNYIFEPLGLRNSIVDPQELSRHSEAKGHICSAEFVGNHWQSPEKAYLTRGMAPAGTVVAMSAADLITFARAYLSGGVTINGERWLSVESVSLMQTPSYEWPIQSQIKRNSIGLGWMISDYTVNDMRVIHHGGATMGFLSMLQIIPQSNIAIAVLTNGFIPKALNGITGELLGKLAGVDVQEPEVTGEAKSINLQDLIGRYESLDSAVDIVVRDNQLIATITPKIDPSPTQKFTLRHMGAKCFASYFDESSRGPNITFVNNIKESTTYLFLGVRLIPRKTSSRSESKVSHQKLDG